MADPLDPVEALRRIAGLCQRCIPGTPWEPALGRHRPYCASRIAIAALAALPAPVPEGVPEDRIVPKGWRVEWVPGPPAQASVDHLDAYPILVPLSDTPHEEGAS